MICRHEQPKFHTYPKGAHSNRLLVEDIEMMAEYYGVPCRFICEFDVPKMINAVKSL